MKLIVVTAVLICAAGANAQSLPDVMPAPPSNLSQGQQLVWSCARLAAATGDVDTFAHCTGRQIILTASQQRLVECAQLSTSVSAFAVCSGALELGGSLNGNQQATLECAVRSGGVMDDFADCMGDHFIGQHLTQQQSLALNCAQQSSGDVEEFANCAGAGILGPSLSEDQKAAIKCAVQSQGDLTDFTTCAENRWLDPNLNFQLNPEQQIALQCFSETGGQPYAAAACTASRLTFRELQKCLTDGVGGDGGCFGNSNDLWGRNGWTATTFGNAWHDLQYGFGPNNDLFGGQGVAGQALEAIRQNAPPPLQVGSVAGYRVCVPWC